MFKTITGKPVQSGKAFRLAAVLLGSTALFGLTLAGAANANETWTGATSTDWFTAGNWNGNAVPANTDVVTIDTIAVHPTVIDNNNAVAHDMTVGDIGTGALTIQTTSTLNVGANVTLGNHANSIGTITVNASDLNDANGFVFVGANGTGNVTVQNSGSLEANVVILGEQAGSGGNLTISGTGSSMTLSNGITVGSNGTGSFSLLNGATANTVDVSIGDIAGSGTVLIDGTGTLLTNTSDILIGNENNLGDSGTLTVSNGGEVETGRTIIGNAVASTGTVTVTDANSFLVSNNDLEVGSEGNGTLNIQNGGTVFAVTQTVVGEQPGGMGTIAIDGADSTLNATASIFVGGDGVDPTGGNGTITVTNGGTIQDFGSLFLGNPAGSTGNVTISGTDSVANIIGSVRVGADGSGALTISGGGALNAANLIAGWDTGSAGSINVTGAGSILNVSGDLAVAESGNASMSVLAGANVSDLTASIASDTGSGTVTVDGTGSVWKTTNTLNIAENGNGVLTISGGGEVDAHTADVASDASVIGAVNVTGAGSKWNVADTITVGDHGAASVTVQNGGVVSDATTVISLYPDANAIVTVDGAGSAWNTTGTFSVGFDGPATLTVTNGAQIADADGLIGFEANGTATLDGAGSHWSNSVAFMAGLVGNGTLTVSHGAVLSDPSGYIGVEPGAVGAVTVTDAGSEWTSTADMVVGGTTLNTVTQGGTGTLTVEDGGSVSDLTGYIGNLPGAMGTATVDGAGSSWASAGTLYVGGDGATGTGTGTLVVSHGGTLTGANVDIGASVGSTGTATIDGADSSTTATDDVFVGQSGSGTLHISNGGTLSDAGGTIASNTGSNGIATVEGAGSAWINTAEVTIGAGGTGVLTVSNGATVSTPNLVITDAGTGTLNIGADASSAAAAPGTIDTPLVSFNGGTGTVIFNHTGTNYTFAPAISGNGSLDMASGTTILTADSTAFTGSTELKGGTLLVDGKLGGSGVDAQGGTLGGSGTIAGTAIIESGATLQGVQGQTLSMGSLKLQSGANIDVSLTNAASPAMFDIAGNLTLDGALNISTPGSFGPGVYRIADYGGTLTNNGLDIGITPTGSTAANFAVQTSVAGEVDLVSNVQVGILQFWDGGAATNAANNAVDGGSGVWSVTVPHWTVVSGAFNGAMNPQPGFAIFEGAPGTVTVDDAAGAVGVTGMQFAKNGYTVGGNAITLTAAPTTIRVGDATSAGAAYTATISSALIGTGGLDKTDLGTLALTGVNSYAGGTAVTGGTLVGSATSFGAGNIADNATLVINQPADAAFANAISGTGAFIKRGAGSLNLTGTSALSGATTVAAGRLAVNGSLANSIVTVQSGATLGGNGTVGGVIAQAGSSVGPGNSIGLLNVKGNYSQASGATYQVELTSAGQSDRIVATGTATLASGAILNVTKTDAAPFVLGTQYTVLTAAGGVSGSFTVTGDLATSPFIGLVEHSDASDIYFDVAKTQSFASAGATHNQIATGGGADGLPAAGPLSTALLNLPSVDAARDALDQLSGEIGASAKTAAIEDGRFVRDAAVGRLRDVIDSSGEVSGWAEAFGSWGSTDGNGNAANLNRSVGGFLAGIDMPVWDDWRAGVLAGYSQSNFNVTQRASSGTSDNYHVGIYGGTQNGALGVRMGAAYTWNDLSIVRSVAFQGFNNRLSGNYDAGTAQVFGDVGYRIDTGNVGLEPFADLAYVNLKTDGFRETGGAAALTSRSDTTDVTFSTLGLRGSHDLDVNDTVFTLNGTFGWRRAFGDVTPSSTVAFAGGANFNILGVPVAKDSLAIDAGFNVAVALGVKLGLSYTGQIASHAQDNGIKGILNWQF